MKTCPRCQGELRDARLSWFTGETVCAECSHNEKGAPNFQRAHLAGLESYALGGEIEGIGFTQEDMQYLRYTRKTNTRGNHEPKRYPDHPQRAAAR